MLDPPAIVKEVLRFEILDTKDSEAERTSENQFILFVLSLLIWRNQKSDPTSSIRPIPRREPE